MYIPQPGDTGTQLIQAALRDFLAQDATLQQLLPEGSDSILPEGFLRLDTVTPALMFTVIGDGNTGAGIDDHLLRLLLYVVDRGRGYYLIERILERMRTLLNSPEAMEFLTFPPETNPKVIHLRATGTTASTTLPRFDCEARGLYVFIHLSGVPTGW